ncbi:MAG: efflux RND transporter permease subunit, partial [Nannocystaceae bacterium]
SVNVFVTSGASTVEVTRAVKDTLPSIKARPELGDVEIEIFEDEGEQIVKTLKDLRNSGIFGGTIGIVMLFLFLRRLRTTFVAAICIPLSILAATGILFFRGQELNCVVMLGLVLGVGIFIDNAVVIVESIQAQAQAGASRARAARIGARQVGLATIASTLSSAIVFLPLLSDNPADPMTTYLQPLGITFVIALIASLFVSQTIIPMVMARGKGPPRRHTSPGMEWLRGHYGRLIAVSLRWPRATLLLGVIVSASTAWPLTQARFDLSEVEEETRSVRVRLEIVGKSGFERVIGHLKQVEEALLSQADRLQITSVHCNYADWYGNCRVYPSRAFQSEQEVSDFEAQISSALPEQVGIKYHLGDGRGWYRRYDPKVVRFVLRGDNMDTLFRLAKTTGEQLERGLPRADPEAEEPEGVERIVGPYDEGRQELSIDLDIDRVHALQLRATDVAQAISSGFEGVSIGQASGPEGEVSIRMSSRGESEEPTITELKDFRIAAPDGTEIPLRALATFSTTRSPYWIQRLDRQTEVSMSVHFAGGNPQANKAAVFDLLKGMSLPAGYSAGEGTRWWKEQENKTEMLVNLGLCLLLVYAVMASLFESFLQPAAIMLTCLLGCFGAPWAMYATDTTIDTVALIGLFILIGIAVNNGIILIDKSLQLRAEGMDLVESLCESGRQRLRPILMTASTTILGLIPMLVYHPTLAGIYYHSIAIIVAAGLLSSTLVTLLFLPAAYLLIDAHAANARALWRRFS